MKVVIKDSRTQGLEFIYAENFWTGRRTISYNGQKAEKKNRNLFVLHLKNGDLEFQIKGNNFTGIKVYSSVFKEPVEVRRKLSPLEIILIILSLALGIAGGFVGGWAGGVIGGVLQGALYGVIGALFFTAGMYAALYIKRKWLRYLVCAELVILSAGLTFFVGYGLALLQLALI